MWRPRFFGKRDSIAIERLSVSVFFGFVTVTVEVKGQKIEIFRISQNTMQVDSIEPAWIRHLAEQGLTSTQAHAVAMIRSGNGDLK